MIDLSIVIPTCNRAPLLRAALAAVVRQTRCSFEILVVDGASADATPAVLESFQQTLGDRLTVFREPGRRGFVRAANSGLRAARGRNVCWLNDDARPAGFALDEAVTQIDASPASVLAMFHRWQSPKNVAFVDAWDGVTYSVCHVRGTLYANFPVARRTTFERLGFLDERYRFCAADPDFSLAAWNAGLTVRPAWGVRLDHDQHADDRRDADADAMTADNAALFDKWTCRQKTRPSTTSIRPARAPCAGRGRPRGGVARQGFIVKHGRRGGSRGSPVRSARAA